MHHEAFLTDPITDYVRWYLESHVMRDKYLGLADEDDVLDEVVDEVADNIECDLEEMVRGWLERHGCQCHDAVEAAAEKSHERWLGELKDDVMDDIEAYFDSWLRHEICEVTQFEARRHTVALWMRIQTELTKEQFAVITEGGKDDCHLTDWIDEFIVGEFADEEGE